MLVDRPTCDAVLAGDDLSALRPLWKQELDEFLEVSARYLLYK